MFTPRGVGLEILDPLLTTRATVVLLAASTIVLFPRDFVVGPRLIASRSRVATVSRAAVMTVALPTALLVAASGSFSPFLYFQF